jgi:carbamoylphosphate synthase large subunit
MADIIYIEPLRAEVVAEIVKKRDLTVFLVVWVVRQVSISPLNSLRWEH